MKNISTPIDKAAIQNATVFENEKLENFDKKEFGDVIDKLEQIKFEPSAKVLNRVLKFARNN